MTDSLISKLTPWSDNAQTRYAILRQVLNSLTVLVALFILFPVYWVWNTALHDIEDMYDRPTAFLPTDITFSNFEVLFAQTDFTTFYINSIILAGGVIVLTTVLSTLAGYGLTRLDIPHKQTFARTILFGYMFPPILLAIPMYIIWQEVGLLNSRIGAIIAVTATGLPITIWIMWQFFQSIPISLEESARMAGASRFRAFYEIALPSARPGIMAIATFSYAHAWTAYTIPKILLVGYEQWPLTVGIESFIRQSAIRWPMVMSSIAMALIPSFLFLYILRDKWEVISV
jgi:multiple sugar transport system permease protein